MTRADIVARLGLEMDALFPGFTAFEPATADDVDRLWEALREVLDDCREQIEGTDGDA